MESHPSGNSIAVAVGGFEVSFKRVREAALCSPFLSRRKFAALFYVATPDRKAADIVLHAIKGGSVNRSTVWRQIERASNLAKGNAIRENRRVRLRLRTIKSFMLYLIYFVCL